MANTKPIGVAYADPELESAVVTGNLTAGTITAGVSNIAGVVSTSFTSTSPAAVSNGVAGLYFLTTAITAGVTTTTAPAGSLATTTNATGAGKLFTCVGGKWEYPVVA